MDWPPFFRWLLWPYSVVYGMAVRLHAWLYQQGIYPKKRLSVPVISVGNLTVGGTGKTPMVLWLAEKFLSEKKHVAILSRGYRGVDGTSDEIEMMKRRLGNRVVFGVGPDRYKEGSRLQINHPIDVFLLDDGFQHLELARDVDIVMLDGSKPLKNERLLPAGSLREPIQACRRSDILVVTRKFERPPIEANDSHEHNIFYAQTRLLGFRELGHLETPSFLSELGSGPFFGFCGIGNPQAFFDDLRRWNVPLAGSRKFGDHHRYSQSEAAELEALAEKNGATALVTTEKDEQNLRAVTFKRLPVFIAAIDLAFSSESEFVPTLERILSERRSHKP